MKIKIVFTEPPYDALNTHPSQDDEKLIFIKDPYTITKDDDGRIILDANGTRITYEVYCVELTKLINDTVNTAKMRSIGTCDGIIIEGCKEPPNFAALMASLAKANVLLSAKCDLIFKDCSFGGALYVNAVTQFVRAAHAQGQDSFFNITLDEQDKNKSILSEHDQARLASLDKVIFSQYAKSPVALRKYIDDTLVERPRGNSEFDRLLKESRNVKHSAKTTEDRETTSSLKTQLKNPTYLYRSELSERQPSRHASMLLNFFSQSHQQQSDYTCGPSAIKMVANYYHAMGTLLFCGEPIANRNVWKALNSSTEFELSERVKTTEEVGSEIADIRDGLMEHGLQVMDDCDGLSPSEHDAETMKAHKEQLWSKIEEILALGLPVIINLRDWEEVGHYEVAIGVDGNNIIFAEPGAALTGVVDFETIPKEDFYSRWRNMSGQRHGRFLVIPPNEASAQKIETILKDMPHYFNGKGINKPTPASLGM